MEERKRTDRRLSNVFYVDNNFHVSLEKYEKLLEFQGGGCAICGRMPTKTRLAWDHCHISGRLRGLLCLRCNRAYGLFHDNSSERLLKAAYYLINPPFVQLFGERYTAPGRLGTKKRAKLLAQMRKK